MEKISTVTGVAVPLRRSNVDTDQIIPAVFLKRVTKTGFDDALFHAWRQDPDFVLNQEPYQGRHASSSPAPTSAPDPPASTPSGRCATTASTAVLSPRFGDIFRGNSGKQGLLAGQISEEDAERLWAAIEAQPGIEATVDLVAKTASVGEVQVSFDIDDYTRWRLLEGLDDIALTLRDEARISEFEARRASWRPKTLPVKQ